MPRGTIASPSDFSRSVIAFVRRELRRRNVDVTGRWLASQTTMQTTYLYTRLIGDKPFNTNDLDEIARAFGYASTYRMILDALELEDSSATAVTPRKESSA